MSGANGHPGMLESDVFPVNQDLVAKARSVLSVRQNLFWIIGGSCTGKSTVCQAISARYGIHVCDLDEHIYGSYMSRYTPERHPASKAWFSAPNPLAWVLSLSWVEFDALLRAADAEYLDLLADDLQAHDGDSSLLVDGGISHPSVLTQVVSPDKVLCVEAPEADRLLCWETSSDRAIMREWIAELAEPERMWQKFLYFDQMLTQTISAESHQVQVRSIMREENTSVEELAGRVAEHFGLWS